MRPLAFFLLFLTLGAGCVLEDKPVDPGCNPLCGDDTPVCNANSECVECTAEDDSYCTDMMLVCKTGAFECVDCNTSTECNDPGAAHCNAETNECDGCESDADCDGIEGLPRCQAGLCVECTPEMEADDCSEDSCNPLTFTCTDTVVGSVGTCEECVSDSECGEDGNPSENHRCAEMFHDGERYPDSNTGFCLKVFAPGECEQPYAIRISDRESLSGDPLESYCGITETLATCPAVRALKENQECPGGEGSECPESGLCRDVGGLPNRCTYRCTDVAECKEQALPGSTCSTGSGEVDYCGG